MIRLFIIICNKKAMTLPSPGSAEVMTRSFHFFSQNNSLHTVLYAIHKYTIPRTTDVICVIHMPYVIHCTCMSCIICSTSYIACHTCISDAVHCTFTSYGVRCTSDMICSRSYAVLMYTICRHIITNAHAVCTHCQRHTVHFMVIYNCIFPTLRIKCCTEVNMQVMLRW